MTLLNDWRARAQQIAPYAPPVAQAIRDCANELEAAQAANALELISLREAALVSGYSADSLGKMIREGRLINHGTKRRPKVRRVGLPLKARSDVDVEALAVEGRRAKRA